MGVYSLKPGFQRTLDPLCERLVAAGVHPDLLTAAGLAVSLLGGICLAAFPGAPWLLLLAPPAALVRTVLNALDGMVARASGLSHARGEFLNEVCDRLSDVALFGGLTLSGAVRPELGAAAITAMLLASQAGVASRSAGGDRQYGGVMGKADRMLWLSGGALVAFLAGHRLLDLLLVLVAAGSAATFAQRSALALKQLP